MTLEETQAELETVKKELNNVVAFLSKTNHYKTETDYPVQFAVLKNPPKRPGLESQGPVEQPALESQGPAGPPANE